MVAVFFGWHLHFSSFDTQSAWIQQALYRILIFMITFGWIFIASFLAFRSSLFFQSIAGLFQAYPRLLSGLSSASKNLFNLIPERHNTVSRD